MFVLIGLQLHYVLETIRDYSLGRLILYGSAFSVFLILLRLVWIYPGAYLANKIRRYVFHQDVRVPPWRQTFVVGWTGMRGVISLAAAIALPQTLANGSPFVQRNMIIFLAFCVILVTLVLQGLTLPPLIRSLGLAGVPTALPEEQQARRTILQAALTHLEEARGKSGPVAAEAYDDLTLHYRRRLETLTEDGAAEDRSSPGFYRSFIDLSRELLRVERQTAVGLRNQRQISDELLREMERELDLEESRLVAKQAQRRSTQLD